MAEIMSRTDLFSPADRRALPPPLSRKRLSPSLVSFSFKSRCSSFKSDFHGRRLVCLDRRSTRSSSAHALSVQMGLQSMKWWEKGLQINMKEVESAQDLVDALLDAGNRLVVVDFFSPGCGGCRALHPKICQIAEMNPNVTFLHVNYEQHKSMCCSLNVHVLPFFRFYRGAQGRICSFSCTNATIKKFRDALAKHTTDRCSLGPAKGLEESELMVLAANKDLKFNYTRNPGQEQVHAPDTVTVPSPTPKLPIPVGSRATQELALVPTGR